MLKVTNKNGVVSWKNSFFAFIVCWRSEKNKPLYQNLIQYCWLCFSFLAGEYLFEQMSSVKTRKHYVLGDLGFSGLWAFMYFVGFCYLTNKWGDAEEPAGGYGTNNMQAAIAFSFFSIFTWVRYSSIKILIFWLRKGFVKICRAPHIIVIGFKRLLEDLGGDDIALGPHFPLSVVLVQCRRLQDLLVLQGTTKSTRKKSQERVTCLILGFK